MQVMVLGRNGWQTIYTFCRYYVVKFLSLHPLCLPQNNFWFGNWSIFYIPLRSFFGGHINLFILRKVPQNIADSKDIKLSVTVPDHFEHFEDYRSLIII